MAPAVEVSPMVDPLIGAPVGAFIIDRFIAQGGMGRVYTARHHIVDTHRAAVKVLVDTASVADRAAFEKEARAAAGVKSINIVTLLDFGLLDDRSPYLVFELLAGETLEAQLRRRRTIPFAEALGLTQQVLAALSVIHNAGLVHRDIKPANLFLVNDPSNEVVVKVMDLGLAAARPQKYHETGVGTEKELNRAGTPVYASPEQFGELTVAPASDIYSLGVVLYEMVTGEVPFAERPGESESALPRRHTKEKPKQPRGLVNDLPLGVENLMLSMLEKDPRQRPTVTAARNEIVRLRERHRDQEREGPTQIRANPLVPPNRNTDQLPRLSTEEAMAGVASLRRDKRHWIMAAVVAVLLVAGVVIALRGQPDEQVKVEGTDLSPPSEIARSPAAPDSPEGVRAPQGEVPPRGEQVVSAAQVDPKATAAEELAVLRKPESKGQLPAVVKASIPPRSKGGLAPGTPPRLSSIVGTVTDDCVYDQLLVRIALEERDTLLAGGTASRQVLHEAEQELDEALTSRDCHRVHKALRKMRRAAGVHLGE